MQDLHKTREQLIEELEHLRQQLTALDIELSSNTFDLGKILNPSTREDERVPCENTRECVVTFDKLKASNVNVSSGGIGFTLDGGLRFQVKDNEDGTEQEAELVWARLLKDGRTMIGMRFV